MRFSQEAYIDPVLTEEVIQLQIPAANFVSVPAGQPQGSCPVRPSRPCCHTQLRKGRQFSQQPSSEPTRKRGWAPLWAAVVSAPHMRRREGLGLFRIRSGHGLNGTWFLRWRECLFCVCQAWIYSSLKTDFLCTTSHKRRIVALTKRRSSLPS